MEIASAAIRAEPKGRKLAKFSPRKRSLVSFGSKLLFAIALAKGTLRNVVSELVTDLCMKGKLDLEFGIVSTQL